MTMPVRPTDSLVSRLLQQQSRSSSPAASTSTSSNHKSDHVSISNDARHPESNTTKQQDLESQLLRLYTHHKKSEG